jgi:hypothetical protein
MLHLGCSLGSGLGSSRPGRSRLLDGCEIGPEPRSSRLGHLTSPWSLGRSCLDLVLELTCIYILEDTPHVAAGFQIVFFLLNYFLH